jgi:hypothetical protein
MADKPVLLTGLLGGIFLTGQMQGTAVLILPIVGRDEVRLRRHPPSSGLESVKKIEQIARLGRAARANALCPRWFNQIRIVH